VSKRDSVEENPIKSFLCSGWTDSRENQESRENEIISCMGIVHTQRGPLLNYVYAALARVGCDLCARSARSCCRLGANLIPAKGKHILSVSVMLIAIQPSI